MNFSDMLWRRKFSLNLYKSLKVPMAKMTFTSDFTKTERGDLYPLIDKEDGAEEFVCPAKYAVRGGASERLLSAFFPYVTARMDISSVSGSAGFAFVGEGARCTVTVEDDGWNTNAVITHEGGEQRVKIPRDIEDGFALIVSARPGWFDVYTARNDVIESIVSVDGEYLFACNKVQGSVSLS